MYNPCLSWNSWDFLSLYQSISNWLLHFYFRKKKGSQWFFLYSFSWMNRDWMYRTTRFDSILSKLCPWFSFTTVHQEKPAWECFLGVVHKTNELWLYSEKKKKTWLNTTHGLSSFCTSTAGQTTHQGKTFGYTPVIIGIEVHTGPRLPTNKKEEQAKLALRF